MEHEEAEERARAAQEADEREAEERARAAQEADPQSDMNHVSDALSSDDY